MSLKHLHHHEEEEDGGEEIWLLSYSDLMTLLFGFFVLMYAFASVNNAIEREQVKNSMAKAFGGSFVPQYEALEKDLKDFRDSNAELRFVEVQPDDEGIEIVFRSGMFFELGSAEILPVIKTKLKTIIEIVSVHIREAEVRVEGYTDDLPIKTPQYPSNWELSSARASSVVRQFVKFGFDPKRLVAVGFADTRPVVPLYDEYGKLIPENREKNRRVVIKIVSKQKVRNKESAQ